ncbi:MAG: AAA family ATPase [Deltaproteobacteria bacterium]|nr:AAA family ATPase [Deltaproteobacteria bacterium]
MIGRVHRPPGTGKTLCAEVVAGELGRPLLRSVVPGLLSRWVGDTERRIAQIFEDARRHGAALLLDEVDALLRERGAATTMPMSPCSSTSWSVTRGWS